MYAGILEKDLHVQREWLTRIRFVIGGGVSAAGEYFINLIDKYYKECVFHASRQTKIVKAALGNDAGMYGAAKLILGN